MNGVAPSDCDRLPLPKATCPPWPWDFPFASSISGRGSFPVLGLHPTDNTVPLPKDQAWPPASEEVYGAQTTSVPPRRQGSTCSSPPTAKSLDTLSEQKPGAHTSTRLFPQGASDRSHSSKDMLGDGSGKYSRNFLKASLFPQSPMPQKGRDFSAQQHPRNSYARKDRIQSTSAHIQPRALHCREGNHKFGGRHISVDFPVRHLGGEWKTQLNMWVLSPWKVLGWKHPLFGYRAIDGGQS